MCNVSNAYQKIYFFAESSDVIKAEKPKAIELAGLASGFPKERKTVSEIILYLKSPSMIL
jgi:hypothetical protein